MKSNRLLELSIMPVLVIVGIIFILPLVVTLTNAFMSESEIATNYTTALSSFDISEGITKRDIHINLIPNSVTFDQFMAVLVYQPTFLLLLVNSMKLAIPVVAGNLVVSLLSAYGFTIWKFKYKEALFFVYVIVMLMPLQAVLVPNFIIADKLNITNSYLAIILPGIFAPFGTFLLRQTMKSIPGEYIEAAKIDGANSFYIFTYVIIPQMKSGIAALIMLVFIEYWNLVEQAVIFIKDYYKEPLSLFLSRLADGRVGIIFAASCVYMVLPLWLLLVGQEDLEKGIELSGIK